MQTRKMPNKYTTWLIFLSEVILFTEIDLFGHLMMTKVGINREIADNKHIVLLEFQGSISNSGMI